MPAAEVWLRWTVGIAQMVLAVSRGITLLNHAPLTTIVPLTVLSVALVAVRRTRWRGQ